MSFSEILTCFLREDIDSDGDSEDSDTILRGVSFEIEYKVQLRTHMLLAL